MDFSKAEYEVDAVAAIPCANCKAPLQAQYWTVGAASVCERCAAMFKGGPPKAGSFFRVVKATAFGSGAGLAGATLYGLIIHFARMELALITILIGWMVGRSVRIGSENRGGIGYQILAAVMTYCWCMMAYVPDLVQSMTAAGPESVPLIGAIILAPLLALITPFTGAMGFLGSLILAFGIWRGFREPAAIKIEVLGPFELADRGPLLAAPQPPNQQETEHGATATSEPDRDPAQ